MSVYPRVRTAGQAWFVLIIFTYFFWMHWDNPVVRIWAWFYIASMIIGGVLLVIQARRDKKELERQIATGELWDLKHPPKI